MRFNIFLPLYNSYQAIQKAFEHFLATKTTREKYFLAATIVLCVCFIVIDFIYLPLLEKYSALSRLHTHTLKEFALSSDSIQNATSAHLEQSQNIQEKLRITQENIALIQSYLKENTKEPHLNPFALMSELINFAKTHQLSLSSFSPHATLDALGIEGMGSFEEIVALIYFIESHRFFSVDTLSFKPFNDALIHFNIMVIDYRSKNPIYRELL
ncbi:hypothetical protein [Helicobacter hepaticus]|jgi:hypothetical protein|uniref:Uncharacterized protein n=1 Tax=Helicobacter hepaticus (strain ATCC 51449 / 3B1) TaxID=235279 RepID=Q7VH54_HELHP|nr:hypothetical protein [Helicobacter hepaticus]AAP77710.1 hypothetical protein HH_1113 [Helicobacter hepaticus ATCC 51449]